MTEQLGYLDLMDEYNRTSRRLHAERQALLKKLFAEIGENCYIEPPFHSNWGGRHVHLGNNVYFNFNATLVDDTHIYIGDCTMLGPNVVIATAGHPILPELREKALQYNLPVHIGRNCWLGAGVIVLPGVTIGDNTVIGAGSVVTKDIPANVVAVGPGGFVDGNEVKMYVNVGDKVIASKYAGTEVKIDGEEYTIVRQSDILAIVE